LKRTLKGIAAASVVLGTLAAPTSAFAATHYNTTKVAHEYASALKSITVTKTESFTVTIKDSHNKAISGALVSFSSSNTSVATVSSSHVVTNKNGQATVVITGHKAGSATLKVTVNGKSYSYKVTVTQPAAPTVSISGLSDGQMVATATHTVTVTSNEKSVALYLNGKRQSGNGPTFHLTLAQGTNTITAEATNEIGQVAKKTIHVTLGKLAITGAPTSSIGIGKKVTLGLTDADKTVTSGVTWSVDGDGAVIDQKGNFVASAPGTYTVTATYDGQKATAKVVVYGQAAAVQLSKVTNLVANGVSTETIKVNVVDANGATVSDFNGTVDVGITGNGAALLVGPNTTSYTDGVSSLSDVSITNGTGSFQIVAGQAPNLTDTITVNNVTPTGGSALSNVQATATVTTDAQQATSIKLTAPKTIGVNNGTEQATVTAQVLDQTGNPMLSGVYPITFHISGSAATFFVGGSTTTSAQTATIVGNGTASVTLQSVKGNTGSVTVTATADGLTQGSATIQGVVLSNVSKLGLGLTSGSTATIAEGSETSLTATGLDAAGNTISGYSFPSTVMVKVTKSDGSVATNALINDKPVDPKTGEIAIPTDGVFTFGVDTGSAGAGTYNIQVVDSASSNALASSQTVQVTVTPAAPDHITLTAAKSFVSGADTADQFTAQVVDKYGNPVAKASVPVTFYATRTKGSTGTATLNGVTQDGTSTSATVVVNTDANGKATVTLVPQNYDGNEWTVTATPTGLDGKSTTAKVVTYSNTTAKLSVTLKNSGSGQYQNTTTFKAGDSVSLTFAELDNYGNGLTNGENDQLKVTITNYTCLQGLDLDGDSNVTVSTSGNTATFTGDLSDLNSYFSDVHAGKAGSFTVAVSDLSVPGASSASVTGTVLAGGLATHVQVVDPSSVSATGEYGPFTIQLVDDGGNLAPASGDVTLTAAEIASLINGGGSAQVDNKGFRTSPSGADLDTITIPAGTTSVQVWGKVTTAGSFTAADPAALPLATNINVTKGDSNSGQATVTWNDMGADHYNILYSVNGGAWETDPNPIDPSNTTYTYTGTSGDTVRFIVQSVDKNGDTFNSAVQTVTLP
jgi:hypothetical protein